MSLSQEQILDAVGEMSVVALVDLIEAMEKKFNVTAASMTMAMPMMAGGAANSEVEEQTEFNVMLTNFGANKVAVIKVVREITALGLKEAKDLVEGAPSAIKEGIPKADAEKIKKLLEDAGATAEIK